MESPTGGADAVALAATFRWVFTAACLGLMLAWFALGAMEERPWATAAPASSTTRSKPSCRARS